MPTLDDWSPRDVFPRIKASAFVEASTQLARRDDDVPVVEPLVGDLVVTYAVDLGDAFVMLSRSMLRERRLDQRSLRRLAIDNMQRQYPRLGVQELGPIAQLVMGEGMESCMLLVPAVWEDLAAQIGDLAVVVPTREIVMFCALDDATAVELMVSASEQAYEADRVHCLSRDVLVWDGAWSILDEGGT